MLYTFIFHIAKDSSSRFLLGHKANISGSTITYHIQLQQIQNCYGTQICVAEMPAYTMTTAFSG